MTSLHVPSSSRGTFPFENVPKGTEHFPVCRYGHPTAGIPLKELQDLTAELYQTDTFPCAIGEHSDIFRSQRVEDEKGKSVLALKTMRTGSSSNPNFFQEFQQKLVELGDGWARLVHENIARVHGVVYGIGRPNSRQSPPPLAGVPPRKAGGQAKFGSRAKTGKGRRAEALAEGRPLDPYRAHRSWQLEEEAWSDEEWGSSSWRRRKPKADNGLEEEACSDEEWGSSSWRRRKPMADNGLEVLSQARKVRIESLTAANAARDANVTIHNTSHHYYPSPQTEGLGIPYDRSPPQPGRTTPYIRNELVGGYHELGAADSLKASDTDNNYFAIPKRYYQDLHERVELLESAVFQSAHPERPSRDSAAGGHYTTVATPGATRPSGTGGTIATTSGMVVPAPVSSAPLGPPMGPILSAPPYSPLPHTIARPARRANTDGGAPGFQVFQRPSPLGNVGFGTILPELPSSKSSAD